MKASHVLSMAVVGATAALGCGGDNTGPPTEFGRAQGVVIDPQTASFSGTVAGNINVSISADGTTWFDLGSPNGITIQLQTDGASTNVHGERDAPLGTYSWVRITFHQGVEVTLPAGTTLGSTTLGADATITLGGADGDAEITKQVSAFEIAGTSATLHTVEFDLESALWVTESALQAGLVEDTSLQSAVSVTTRSEPLQQ